MCIPRVYEIVQGRQDAAQQVRPSVQVCREVHAHFNPTSCAVSLPLGTSCKMLFS